MSLTLNDLLEKESNQICADCKEKRVIAASINFGVFICESCSGVHRDFNEDVRNLSSANNGNAWSVSAFSAFIATGNNEVVNAFLEAEFPPHYQRPWANDCPSPIKDSFFKDKYLNKCFVPNSKEKGLQSEFSSMLKSVVLQKKLRDSKKFLERKFEIDVKRGIIQYFISSNISTPKEIIQLDKCNIFFINHTHWDLLSNVAVIQFIQEESNRSIFVRSGDSKLIADFFNNIRFGKHHLISMNQSGMGRAIEDISNHLTFNVLLAGYLYKTGPKPGSAWRKRWFVLIDHSIYYYDNPDDAVCKGEILIRYEKAPNIYEGVPNGWKVSTYTPFCFYYSSMDRLYVISSDSQGAIQQWMRAIEYVAKQPYSQYNLKRNL